MMKLILATAALAAAPAYAADGPFFSTANTDFIVLISFLVFVGVLVKFGVPAKLIGLLDNRAEIIRSELEEVRALREEAKAVLASYERKRLEVQEQADRIVATARDEAQAAAEQAKEDLKLSIARRMVAAQERIASAEAGAIAAVREQAVSVAIAAATEVLAKQATAETASASIDAAIKQVEARLH